MRDGAQVRGDISIDAVGCSRIRSPTHPLIDKSWAYLVQTMHACRWPVGQKHYKDNVTATAHQKQDSAGNNAHKRL